MEVLIFLVWLALPTFWGIVGLRQYGADTAAYPLVFLGVATVLFFYAGLIFVSTDTLFTWVATDSGSVVRLDLVTPCTPTPGVSVAPCAANHSPVADSLAAQFFGTLALIYLALGTTFLVFMIYGAVMVGVRAMGRGDA